MNQIIEFAEKLFSYGTLQYESVQLSTFGRILSGQKDGLVGYSLTQLTIENPDVVVASGTAVHPILEYSGNKEDMIKGMVFDITAVELQQADEYEVADYKRVRVQLISGTWAWVYVSKGSTIDKQP